MSHPTVADSRYRPYNEAMARIMIVDDEEEMCRSLAEILEGHGHEVRPHEDDRGGEEIDKDGNLALHEAWRHGIWCG